MTAIPSTDTVPANGEDAPLPQPSQVPVAEIQLRLMADQMPAVLWTTDTDLRYTFIRGSGLLTLGLPAEDILGVTVEEVYDQIGRSGHRHHWER